MSENKEIKYSYSRLETYENCPFRYYLKYIEEHYAKTSSIALDFGTIVHAVEEEIGNCLMDKKPVPYEILIDDFCKKCAQLKEKYPEAFMEKDKSNRTYEDKINFYINKGIYRLEQFLAKNKTLEIIGTEIPFEFTYKSKLFRGYIDRVLHDTATNQYIVQDIKTYAVPLKDNGPADRDPHLVTPLQFVTYCMALQNIYDVDPNSILCGYDLPLADIIQEAGTKGFISRGCNKLDKIFSKIDEANWAPKPSALCHWCEYCRSNKAAGEDTKHLCPYFSHWTREKPSHHMESEWMGLDQHQAILEAYHKRYNIVSQEQLKK